MISRKPLDPKTGFAYGVLRDGLYLLAMYKKLHEMFTTGCYEIIEHAFRISVSDNAIQMAAVQWCKVSGMETMKSGITNLWMRIDS